LTGITKPLIWAAVMAAILLSLSWSPNMTTEAQAPAGQDAETVEISDDLRDPENAASLLVDDAASTFTPTPFQVGPDGEAEIGDQLRWVALNDEGGFFYTKVFELRAADDTAEIWIAVGEGRNPDTSLDGIFGLDFPAGDCRNDGVRNAVTDEQAQYLLGEFSGNIKNTDEDWFGEPVFRDGSGGALPRPSPFGKQVVLVDNVRDANFYDTNNASTFPYIAGFFTSAMDVFHNRNVMTIDGYDWLHRTGADPLHEPSADPCTSAPARPFLYEGVFAHEYQHLIHQDYDPDEVNWVNEGMSDLAIFLTGYSDPSKHIDEKGNDSHPMNYQGWASVPHPDWNPIPRPSGPENSLTAWEDQGPNEVLEDYGFAYQFMLYLLGHGYDQDFFTDWHHNTLNGIAGLDDTLATMSASATTFGASADMRGHGHDDDDDEDTGPPTFDSLFYNMIVSTLVDAYIDAGGDVHGASADALQTDALNSTVFFSTNAYGTPGAPPWGADYIPLGRGNKLKKLMFDGADTFVFPGGNDWTIDSDGYWTTPDEPGGTTYPDGLDSSIAREVTVPDAPAELTFEHWYQTELGWDFAFVQVLTPDGFVSLPCTGTTTDHNPSADPFIAAQVPGYTGPTEDPTDPSTSGTPGAPLAATCDLSAYAGQTVPIAFRLMTDPAVTFDGWHIRNVAINGTPVDSTPDDISDWDNEQFFQPLSLGFNLTLVGIEGEVNEFGHVTDADDIVVVRPELSPGATYSLTKGDRKALKHSDMVVAMVTGVPEDESVEVHFPYSLKVNGKERADGAGLP
jgi:hypothetical protein